MTDKFENMASEDSVYLIKDYTIETTAGDGWNRVFAKDIHVVRHRDSIGQAGWVDAISRYIINLKCAYTRVGIMHLKASREQVNQQTVVDIYLKKDMMERLCRFLPNPFLHIISRVQLPSNMGRTIFEKRLELADVVGVSGFVEISNDNYSAWRLLTICAPASGGMICDCDILLGWVKPSAKPEGKGIRMSPATFMANVEPSKDLTIVAGNGAEVKCHRIMFQAHSDVFAAMVSPSSGMLESTTGRVEMRENSEEGLTHLVRYLYGMELAGDDLPCDVVVELFKTSHKYKLNELQDGLVQLLLQKESEWFTPDELLELYFHVKNLEEFKELQKHSLCVMIRHSQAIRESERFRELKRTDGEAAIGLVWKLFDSNNAKK